MIALADLGKHVRDPDALLTRPQVLTRCGMYCQGLSNGTDTGSTFRYRHVAPYATSDLRVAYGNIYGTAAGPHAETPGPNNLSVRGSIESPAGTFYPLFFNGQRDIVIQPGAIVVSDPIGVDVAAGAFVFTRTYVTVTSGGKWPLGLATFTANGDGNNRSATPTDLTTSGTMPTAFEFGYGPLAVCGNTDPRNPPTVLLLGDSVGFGQGDAVPFDGFLTRALNSLIPYTQITIPGELASDFAGTSRKASVLLARGFPFAISRLITSAGWDDKDRNHHEAQRSRRRFRRRT